MCKTTETPIFSVHVEIDGKPFTLHDNFENGNGERQIFLNMSDQTTLCVTHVTHNLEPYNAYYTVKHYANQADIIAKKYRTTNNEKCSFAYATIDQLTAGLNRYLNKILKENNVSILPEQKEVIPF